MLTEEALRERKWGPFPTLRKALEDKHIPYRYDGFTSVSDNRFAQFYRMCEIADLAHEYESAVRETAQSVGREHILSDLLRLRDDLRAASFFFKEQAEGIEALLSKVLG